MPDLIFSVHDCFLSVVSGRFARGTVLSASYFLRKALKAAGWPEISLSGCILKRDPGFFIHNQWSNESIGFATLRHVDSYWQNPRNPPLQIENVLRWSIQEQLLSLSGLLFQLVNPLQCVVI